ncbi:MAG: UbiD family decarboxylase [Candidatus Tectomicrobia bacterium]|nr:UbiD family decarboxylase [Candidatus Tectomicrobia bacterium]
MAYKDLRDYLRVLEENGKLRRVKRQVDPSWEVSCMARWIYQGFPEDRRFGLLFENVKGTSMSVGTALVGASRDVYALALGTPPEKIHDTWLRVLSQPLAPKTVASGPVHEVVIPKEKVDLSYLPVPTWTPEKDKRPCITACCITRDRDSGVQNIGTYRCQVQSKNQITFNTNPGRQGYQNYESYAVHGEPAPVAVAIGCEPAVHLATSAALPKGMDELHVAGALKGEPIEVVRGKTVDILVPAHAEIVVEGLLHPTGRMVEDGFGEFLGYMGTSADRIWFEVTAITHRRDPIYYGYISQCPPSESTMIQGQANECMAHWQLVTHFGEQTVTDVALTQTHGGMLGHAVVQMTPMYPGHAKRVGRLLAEITHFKIITVVDTGIDIRYQQHLDWVHNSLVNPATDVTIIDDCFTFFMDPSRDERGMGGKLILDATHKIGHSYTDLSLPPKHLMWKAYESWQDADLPAFNIPQRVERSLDWHAKRLECSDNGRFAGLGTTVRRLKY